nr:helix-turn-helix transcriptional regulator [uncultured Oscillibacter sp.]
MESGEHRPSLDTLIALADHFGVSLDYLAGRSDRREL